MGLCRPQTAFKMIIFIFTFINTCVRPVEGTLGRKSIKMESHIFNLSKSVPGCGRPLRLDTGFGAFVGCWWRSCLTWTQEGERERERDIHYIHSASLAYADGILFMSEPSAARQ